jgi:DNA-binding PadR family transcriptional regulator
MKSTMLKMFILRRVGNSKANSYAMLKEFRARRGFMKSFGSQSAIKNEVYNTVKSLEKSGYIKSSQKIENGRLKNYYMLTRKGKDTINSASVLFKKHAQQLSLLLSQ